ncbi:magnesium/cobalt transporter CorA [bacterium]|nr:magnesium/cobalt transporter CorA [bacterium]
MKHSFITRHRRKAGMAPGSLFYTGDEKELQTHMHAFVYNSESVEEADVARIGDIDPGTKGKICWLNVTGLNDTKTIQDIGQTYQIHPLVLEDILHVDQRPKLDDADDSLFMVLKMVTLPSGTDNPQWEQVSFIIRKNMVITFQELPNDAFDSVRKRLRENAGRIRKSGADYLAYALMDALVDHYFVFLEVLGERLESLEDRLIADPGNAGSGPGLIHHIYQLRREMIFLRRSVWPLREVVGGLEKTGSGVFQKTTLPFLKDLYDHTVQVMETVELYRDMLSGLRDNYLSALSNRMNAVMQVLTVIATIFIPLTFIAGVYGMNFEWMPELRLKWAYPAVWLIMCTAALFMVLYFKKKRWL